MIKHCNKTLLASAISVAVVGTANAAIQLEEVMVTATRRAESVQDVPYNISAIQGDDIAAAGITDIAGLASRIPGVSYTDRGARGSAFNSGIAMRGMSIEDGRLSGPLSTAPAVGTYVNETPLFINLRLSDIERVEVLRGPQGTLYGSGSMGGAMRFIQAKPSMEGFEAEISADVSQTKNGDGINNSQDLMLNMPVSDTLAVRANLGRSDEAGWIDRPRSYVVDGSGVPVAANPANAGPGVIDATLGYTENYFFTPVLVPGGAQNFGSGPVYESVDGTNEEEAVTGRLSVLWQPNDEFEGQLSYQYQKDESQGNPVQAVDHPDYGEYESPILTTEPYEGTTDLVSLDMSYDMGFASVTASLSHYETEQEFSGESTGIYQAFEFYQYTYGFMPRPLATYENTVNDEADIIELRLTSQSDGDVDWVIGLFHMDQDGEIGDSQYMLGYQDYADACVAVNPEQSTEAGFTGECGAGTTLDGGYIAPITYNQANQGGANNHPNADANGIPVVKDQTFYRAANSNFTDTAVFGELTYHVTEEWQVTGGFRSFEQKFESTQASGAVMVDSLASAATKFDASDTLFKLNTSWDVNEETMLYATWSEGFRRGGSNAMPTFIISNGERHDTPPSSMAYDGDKVTNREIGIKGSINDRFTYTLSYFDIEWENVQLNADTTAFVLPTVLNLGEASTKGVELEFAGGLTENLYMTIGYSYVEAEITDPDPEGAALAAIDSYSLARMADDGDTAFNAADMAAAVASGAGVEAMTGVNMPGVSRNTFSLNLDYTQNLDDGMSVVYNLNGTYRSETLGELSPTLATTADSFQMWNAYVTLDSGDAWSARLYVDNVFDEIGIINTADEPNNGPRRSQIISRPRTVGVGVSYTF